MRESVKTNRCIYLAGIMGAVLFCMLYGTAILNPAYDDWLLAGGDLSQHYLGWVGFRNSKWFFPIGLFNTLSYPETASVIFVDAVPLFAILFKLLSPILPKTFQYHGLWGLCCFVLQGMFSAAILKKFLKNNLLVLLSCLFFILSPVMIFRFYGHEALGAHWIVLLALWTLWHRDSEVMKKHAAKVWSLIGVLAASVHMYFVPMCGIILVGFLTGLLMDKRGWKAAFKILLSFILAAFLTVWLLGGFHSFGSSYHIGGLGDFSFNLNGFWNSMNVGRLGKELPLYSNGQQEGFAYLGTGLMALLAVGAAGFLFSQVKRNGEKQTAKCSRIIVPCAVTCALSILAAALPILTYGAAVIFSLPMPVAILKVWTVFRAGGRFIWPCYYVIFFCAAGLLNRISWKKLQYMVLAAAVILQIYDVQLLLKSKAVEPGIVYESPLQAEIWGKLAERGMSRLVFTNTIVMDEPQYYLFAAYGLKNKMTLNNYAFAHPNYEMPQIEAFSDDEIYILNGEIPMENVTHELTYYRADGYTIGVMIPVEGETPAI